MPFSFAGPIFFGQIFRSGLCYSEVGDLSESVLAATNAFSAVPRRLSSTFLISLYARVPVSDLYVGGYRKQTEINALALLTSTIVGHRTSDDPSPR